MKNSVDPFVQILDQIRLLDILLFGRVVHQLCHGVADGIGIQPVHVEGLHEQKAGNECLISEKTEVFSEVAEHLTTRQGLVVFKCLL